MTKNQQLLQQEKTIKTLTDKEKLFAELAAENFYASETKPNYQLAIEAGYAEKSARQRAYENLNPRIKPYVVLRIEELKEDFRVRNQITPDKHMARLNQLGKKAENKGNLSVAGRMEELRGRVAGYYIDRKLVGHKKSMEDMTAEELDEQIKKIEEDWGRIASHDDKTK
jgi:hypothetical protein